MNKTDHTETGHDALPAPPQGGPGDGPLFMAAWCGDMPLAPPTRGEGVPFEAMVKAVKESLPSAADILDEMAATFRERNAVYGSNYKMVAPLVSVLFPNGVPSDLVHTHKWHLFELMLVKLSRLAISNLTHTDSIHDAGVYAAMVEFCMREEGHK